MTPTDSSIRTAIIDPNACIRCRSCCSTAPSVFICPPHAQALPLLTPKAQWLRDELEHAAACCPATAIDIFYEPAALSAP